MSQLSDDAHEISHDKTFDISKSVILPMLLSGPTSREASRNATRQLLRLSGRSACLSSVASISSLRKLSDHQTTRFQSTSTDKKLESTVNADEVSHFTKLAASWLDPHGPSRLLHLMNPLRHDFIKSCTGYSDKKGLTYLDIGCGGGIFASSAARLSNTSKVVAIDPTPEVIAVAKEHQRNDPLLSKTERLTYLNSAIEELETYPEYEPQHGFDFVSVFEVIEHIDKPAAFLRQAVEHLKPGGWLIGSTIARHPLSYLTTKIVAEAPWPIGVVPRGTHDWNKYINPVEICQWFEKENLVAKESGKQEPFGPVRIEGCAYLPLVGWKFINGTANVGNYFFGVQKLPIKSMDEQPHSGGGHHV